MIDRRTIMDSLKLVRGNTLEIARDIPAEKYDFKPVEGYNSVLEQFHQILKITEFMTGLALHEGEIEMSSENRDEWFAKLTKTRPSNVKTKVQVVEALETSFADIEKRVLAADEKFITSTFKAPDKITKERLWVVNCAKEQEMSLRGQLFLFERMLGIIPHTTRKQMERKAVEKAAKEK